MPDDVVRSRLRSLKIETPSWAYGNSGTRFHVYPWPGAARDVRERIADAGLVHRLTGCCPTVALHIPWDRVDDWAELAAYAESEGVRIGAINPNVFGDDAYRLGASAIRMLRAAAGARPLPASASRSPAKVGSTVVSLWLADGTNYPGQDSLRGRYARLNAGLDELYAALPDGVRLLVEYKFFEPGFFSTDLPDWGTAALICRRLGPQAQVLVDTGHHAQGTNVEQIVALLLAEGLLGGFHFNNRKYADDDLIVGAIDPFELFRIMREIALAQTDPATSATAAAVEFMIDQSHNIEGKVDAMIQSVMNIQTAYAKALLVDEDAVAAAQADGDVLGAHRLLLAAFETDVRPLLAELRAEQGLEADPGRRVPRRGARRASRSRAGHRCRCRARTSRCRRVRVALFVTCIGDTVFPEAGRATVRVLERLGHEVVFPAEQTCCGQMHVNSGYRGEALGLARRFVEIFGEYDVVVSPSSSCVGNVRELYPQLAREAGDTQLEQAVARWRRGCSSCRSCSSTSSA